ncbi:MAG TPA: ABC transporter permease [Ktedonosporobacter sp.]|nr:ABC transporter permease [Ktedonosporobacter sp.]
MRFIIRRIGFYLITLWAALTLNFILPRLVPGDPAEAIIQDLYKKRVVPPETMRVLAVQFGLSTDPLWVQYLQYINNLFHGQMGLSISKYPYPVMQILLEKLPWTIGLGLVTLVIGSLLGTLLGVINAWRRGSFIDNLLSPLMILISGIPYFWLGLLVLYLLGFVLNWFPIEGGGYDATVQPGWTPDFWLSVIQYGTLPALTLIVTSLAGWMLTMRNTMITTLSEDYVLMAKAKGLTGRIVMLSYAARNAVLPSITGFALSLGFILGGQFLTESVFSYPGIGYTMLVAVHDRDYPLMQGLFLLVTLSVLAANLIADLLYSVLDPRIRQGKG